MRVRYASFSPALTACKPPIPPQQRSECLSKNQQGTDTAICLEDASCPKGTGGKEEKEKQPATERSMLREEAGTGAVRRQNAV